VFYQAVLSFTSVVWSHPFQLRLNVRVELITFNSISLERIVQIQD
jgi:hypothetical protein